MSMSARNPWEKAPAQHANAANSPSCASSTMIVKCAAKKIHKKELRKYFGHIETLIRAGGTWGGAGGHVPPKF